MEYYKSLVDGMNHILEHFRYIVNNEVSKYGYRYTTW